LRDKRVQYFLLGLLIFYWQNIVFNILLPIFLGVSQYYFLGDYSTIILLGFTAFSIIRYRLFNIKTVAAEVFTFSIWTMLVVRVSRDILIEDILIDSLLLVFSIIFGILLVKSVLGEVKQKEELQTLSGKLQDLNDHLEQKVAEQTVEIRKSYEVEKKARIELEKLDKTKDQFILTTQHHLRTPLTIIKEYLSVIKDDPSLSRESHSNLEKVSSSTDTLSQFINELLQITELKVKEEDNEQEK
jgi:signal transduction histidine kinase